MGSVTTSMVSKQIYGSWKNLFMLLNLNLVPLEQFHKLYMNDPRVLFATDHRIRTIIWIMKLLILMDLNACFRKGNLFIMF